MKKYLFTSNRLGFRKWLNSDLEEFAKLNADLEVMEHFPKPLTKIETAAFIKRLQKHYSKHGFNYFAVEILETSEFIGFVGLAYQTYKSAFTPAIDIGWRLKKAAWGKGFATEGAKKCLEFGFDNLKIKKIIATCTHQNTKSENVMLKIGMRKKGTFKHPNLKEHPAFGNCLLYEIKNPL